MMMTELLLSLFLPIPLFRHAPQATQSPQLTDRHSVAMRRLATHR